MSEVDIVDRLLDFERYGLTASERVNIRECAAIEIHRLRTSKSDLMRVLQDVTCELSCCADQLAARGLKGRPDDSVSRALTAARRLLNFLRMSGHL